MSIIIFLARPAEPTIVGISQTGAKMRITWNSSFDGGYPQYFLIYQQNITVWDVVANISESNATIQSADVPSGPEGVYGVAVMSCNVLGCTMPVKLDRGLFIPCYMQKNNYHVQFTYKIRYEYCVQILEYCRLYIQCTWNRNWVNWKQKCQFVALN